MERKLKQKFSLSSLSSMWWWIALFISINDYNPTSDACLKHNFIWIASIKINACVIWDKKELMNSRDSIIVSLAEADLRQALLIVHFPISDVSPPLAYARVPHRRTSRTLDLSCIYLCFRIFWCALTMRQITWVFFLSPVSAYSSVLLYCFTTASLGTNINIMPYFVHIYYIAAYVIAPEN